MEALSLTSRLPMARQEAHKRGLLLVISGPSGVGKGTIVNHLMALESNLQLSTSVTTRSPRPGEVEGVSYFFRTQDEFLGMVEAGELLEYAQFGDHLYGTPRRFVEQALENGRDVVLEIETRGAIQVKERMPSGVYLFVLPPTMQELENRLVKRRTEAAEAMRQRLAIAFDELNYLSLYDYQIVNDDVEVAVEKVRAILVAERCRVRRNLTAI